MDIFTTALTRVVPVPIKRANLKVKALAKEAAASGVSDDIQGLEDHELYYKKPPKEKGEQQQDELHLEEVVTPSPVPSDNTGQNMIYSMIVKTIVVQKIKTTKIINLNSIFLFNLS